MNRLLRILFACAWIWFISCTSISRSDLNAANKRPQFEYFYPCNNSYKFLIMKREIHRADAITQNFWNGTILLRNYLTWMGQELSASNYRENYVHIELRISAEAKLYLSNYQHGAWRVYSGTKNFHIVFNGVDKPLDRIDFWVEGKPSNRFPQVNSLRINEEELCYHANKWNPTTISYNDVLHNRDENDIWPWFASLLRITSQNTRIFVCGGSIVNEKTIITAASCFYGFNEPQVAVNQFAIELGKFNRNYKYHVQSTVEHGIERLVQHPDYQPYAYEHNNVALVILTIPIAINAFTMPIPLCTQTCYTSNVNPQNERIIGWGPQIEENRLTSNQIPIVAYDDCIRTNPEFYTAYLDHQSFCAGNTTGTQICAGFGGSGLVININGDWYLHSIVSIAPPNFNEYRNTDCYLQNYVIFTDLIFFGSWINANKYEI